MSEQPYSRIFGSEPIQYDLTHSSKEHKMLATIMRKYFDSFSPQSQDIFCSFALEIAREQKRNRELRKKLEEAYDERRRLERLMEDEEELNSLMATQKRLKQEINGVLATNEKLKWRVKSLELELSEVNQKLTKALRESFELSKRLNETGEPRDNESEQIEKLRKENKELRDRIQVLQEEYAILEKLINQKIISTGTEREKEDQEREELETKLKELTEENNRLKEEIQQLQEEYVALEQKFDAIQIADVMAVPPPEEDDISGEMEGESIDYTITIEPEDQQEISLEKDSTVDEVVQSNQQEERWDSEIGVAGSTKLQTNLPEEKMSASEESVTSPDTQGTDEKVDEKGSVQVQVASTDEEESYSTKEEREEKEQLGGEPNRKRMKISPENILSMEMVRKLTIENEYLKKQLTDLLDINRKTSSLANVLIEMRKQMLKLER